MASHNIFLALYHVGHDDEAFAEIARFRSIRVSAEFELTMREMAEWAECQLSSPEERYPGAKADAADVLRRVHEEFFARPPQT